MKKDKSSKKYDPKKELGAMVNKPIDKAGKQASDHLKGAVKTGSHFAKKHGASDKMVAWGGKQAMKHGSKFINQAVGKTKNFIHKEGRNLINQGVEGAKHLGKRVGSKISEGFDHFKKRFKR